MAFTQSLMKWNTDDNHRKMPWKGEKDPYKIWLSEIILQQTRVEQGWQYYERFIKAYPNIVALANAKDMEVFKLWEGLGYYNRCKNLLFTARAVVQNYKGIFPRDHDTILSLKGIGPYTAAAIASFAYNLPYAVLDGNVFRVLSRYFGISTAIDSTEGKNDFAQLADKVLDKKNPGIYNQAIMDFGATVCLPALPKCATCTLAKDCTAFNTGMANRLPIKEKYLVKKTRYLTWFIIVVNNEVYIQQRTGNDIWANLYEFYTVETDSKPNWDEDSVKAWGIDLWDINIENINISKPAKQQLTHQVINGQFISIVLKEKPKSLRKEGWISITALEKYAFPKMQRAAIEYIFTLR